VERQVRKVRVKIGEKGQEVEVGLSRLGGWWGRDTHHKCRDGAGAGERGKEVHMMVSD